MTTEVNINRQTVLVAEIDIARADFGTLVANTAKTVQFGIHLPAGARVVGGYIDTVVAANTAGDTTATFTLSVGDTVGSSPDVDRYRAAVSVKAVGVNALSAFTGAKIPAGGAWVTVTAVENPTGANAATSTTGTWRLSVQYTVENRVTEFHAYRG